MEKVSPGEDFEMLAMKQAFPNTTDAEVGKPKVAKEVGGRKQLGNCMHKKGTLVSWEFTTLTERVRIFSV